MNFRKLCRIACIFFILILSQENALAATIHGKVYEWNSFEPLNNSVVEINSTPEQSFVATNAEYSFNLTPGTYLIKASYYEGNNKVYTTREEVLISAEGEYIHDLLLFPTYEEELLEQSDFEVPDLSFGETEVSVKKNDQTTVFVFAFLAFITVLLLAGYFIKKGHRKHPEIISHFPGENGAQKALQSGSPIDDAVFSEEAEDSSVDNPVAVTDINSELPEDTTKKADFQADKDKSVQNTKFQEHDRWHFPFSSKEQNKSSSELWKNPRINLPEDLKELLELIRNSGNRITQREIRKKSPYSESKVSLMLSDLEQRGLIEKFKRGRGNIIRIPDRYIHKQKEHESKKE